MRQVFQLQYSEARDNSITEVEERADISETQKRTILGENAKRFLGLQYLDRANNEEKHYFARLKISLKRATVLL